MTTPSVHERVGPGDSPGAGALAPCTHSEGDPVQRVNRATIDTMSPLQRRRSHELLALVDRAKVWTTPGGQIRCHKSHRSIPFRADTAVLALVEAGWAHPVHGVYALTDAGRDALAQLGAHVHAAHPVTVRHV